MPPFRTTYRLLSSLFLLVLAGNLSAQSDSTFRQVKTVVAHPELPKPVFRQLRKALRKQPDSLRFFEKKAAFEESMSQKGYAEFSVDSFRIEGEEIHAYVHRGHQYFLHSVKLGEVNEVGLIRSGIPNLVRKQRPFYLKDMEARLGNILTDYQNNGYPFARFDSLEMALAAENKERMLAKVQYAFDPGKLVTIDSVQFEGNKREGDSFLRSVIGIRPGDLYDQSAIDEAPKILNNSIYLKKVRKVKVEFDRSGKKAKLTVPVTQKKAGHFDLLLGILPPRDQDERTIQFTGLADFQLVSPLFKSGEILGLRYDKLVGTSQKLNIQYMHPNIAGTPLRAEGQFFLLKQDTSFLNRNLKLSGYYAFTPSLSLKVWYKSKNSSLISTRDYENDSINLPPVLDGSDNTYGVGFIFNNLDYRFNPTRGFDIRADIGVGRKKIRRNPRIHEDIYSQVNENQPKREAEFHFHYYREVFKRQVLHVGNYTYWLNMDQLFENDLMQVGGANLLRGFNENQFFTQFFSMLTLEYRYLLEQNSYIFVFGDYAYLENRLAPEAVQYPLGLGLGMAYETRAGIVTVTYAVGQSGNSSFQPARGRIHVGLVNQF